MELEDLKKLIEESTAENRRQFERIDARFEGVQQQFERIDARFEGVQQQFERIDARFEGVERQFERIDARFESIDARFDDLRRHFDVTAEGLRHEIRLVAEGVMMVNERVDRLQIEMRDEFADVRATIATLVRG